MDAPFTSIKRLRIRKSTRGSVLKCLRAFTTMLLVVNPRSRSFKFFDKVLN